MTSGGTIPDRGLFGVFLVGEKASRVGELDEEMVYESRVGDVFVLGASSWRIEDITPDRVLVSPAPGQPGKLPFWHGDTLGRPAELGRALGSFTRELAGLPQEQAQERVTTAGLDAWASANLVSYLHEQREATGHVPDDRTMVVERFRDELGDWRLVVHSPLGARVHAPWALAIAAASASGTASTRRPCTRTTASSSASPTWTSRPASTSSPSTPTTSNASSWTSWAVRRCSRHGSASAPRARCSSPAAAPTGACRSGSSASAPRSCWPSRASTRPSRSCWRRCASACRTCSTSPAWCG